MKYTHDFLATQFADSADFILVFDVPSNFIWAIKDAHGAAANKDQIGLTTEVFGQWAYGEDFRILGRVEWPGGCREYVRGIEAY